MIELVLVVGFVIGCLWSLSMLVLWESGVPASACAAVWVFAPVFMVVAALLL